MNSVDSLFPTELVPCMHCNLRFLTSHGVRTHMGLIRNKNLDNTINSLTMTEQKILLFIVKNQTTYEHEIVQKALNGTLDIKSIPVYVHRINKKFRKQVIISNGRGYGYSFNPEYLRDKSNVV